ncbi:AAA family ATPase [Streptomyces sp. UG1]|uniref:helix-turn-helix transcriptional regulator n=1 Tax=Streptomyces sp. UG1 TaxID=3417652 RepID=UPI003CF5597C
MLVDRCSVLESLDESLGRCIGGQGQLVVVSGGLATGKTALLQEFTRTAELDPGVVLLTAAGSQPERSLHMGVVSQLFHSARLSAGIADAAAELIDAETARSAGRTEDQAGEVDAAVLQGLSTLLLELAQSAPVVIGIDDVHHADSASLRVLLHLRRHIQSSPVMLLFGEWVHPGEIVTSLHAEVSRRPDRRVVLNRLTEGGVRELLAIRLGARDAARLAAVCYPLTGGNPLLVSAVAEDCKARAANGCDQGETPLVGAEYRRAVLDCLHRWDRRLLQVGQGLAVLGDLATPKLIGRLLDMTTGIVGQMLDVLDTAGLTETGRFRHPELAATVLESLGTHTRARLHTRAAELLYETGGHPIDIARHVVNSDTVPGPWAVRSLLQAAEKAVSPEETEVGMKGLELALSQCEEPDRRAARTALAQMAWRVNPSAIARHLPALRETLTTGEPSGRIASAVIRHLLWHGDLEQVVQSLPALSRCPDAVHGRLATELSLAHSWIYGTPIDALAGTCRAPGVGDGQVPPPSLTAMWRQGPSDALMQSAEHVLQGRLTDTIPEVGAVALLVLDHAGQRPQALRRYRTLMDSAERQGAISWQALLKAVRADIALRRGEPAAAAGYAGDALSLMHAQSWGVLIGFPLATLISAHTATGDHQRAAALLDRTVPEAMFDTVFGMRYLQARGHHLLAVDRPFAAIDDFELCGALTRQRGLDIPALVPWRTDLAEAQLRLGRRERARRLAVEQLARPASALDARARGVALRIQGVCGRPGEAVALLREAVHVLEEAEDRLELARALAELSRVHQALGELDRARLVARRAELEARYCNVDVSPAPEPRRRTGGKIPLQATPPRRSADITVPGTIAETLSAAEHKVASLAALGHTNREIGRELCITVSTVEQHLTRVYRKLNVHRRTDLQSRLAGLLDLKSASVG